MKYPKNDDFNDGELVIVKKWRDLKLQSTRAVVKCVSDYVTM